MIHCKNVGIDWSSRPSEDLPLYAHRSANFIFEGSQNVQGHQANFYQPQLKWNFVNIQNIPYLNQSQMIGNMLQKAETVMMRSYDLHLWQQQLTITYWKGKGGHVFSKTLFPSWDSNGHIFMIRNMYTHTNTYM